MDIGTTVAVWGISVPYRHEALGVLRSKKRKHRTTTKMLNLN